VGSINLCLNRHFLMQCPCNRQSRIQDEHVFDQLDHAAMAGFVGGARQVQLVNGQLLDVLGEETIAKLAGANANEFPHLMLLAKSGKARS